MAELTTLARPYAKAAFDYAREASDLNTWSSGLAVVAAVCREAKVAKLLDSPTLAAEQKASALIDTCGDQLNTQLCSFVKILAENKRLALVGIISELFESLKAKQEKFSDVSIMSAFSLESSVEKVLADKLKTVLMSDVTLKTVVDSSLIGGVIIRSGDTVIDGSVKGKLDNLAEALGL